MLYFQKTSLHLRAILFHDGFYLPFVLHQKIQFNIQCLPSFWFSACSGNNFSMKVRNLCFLSFLSQLKFLDTLWRSDGMIKYKHKKMEITQQMATRSYFLTVAFIFVGNKCQGNRVSHYIICHGWRNQFEHGRVFRCTRLILAYLIIILEYPLKKEKIKHLNRCVI